MTKDRREYYHFCGDTRKPEDGSRQVSGVLGPAFH
jgi:hypothetical protein